jgi:Tfp pilus assembly protein PilF
MEDAIEHYRKALRAAPDSAEIHNNLGFALFRKGDVDDAITQLEKAVEKEPRFGEAQYNLGVALFQRGRQDDAISHYRQALEADPDSAEVHSNLGVALLRKGNYDEATLHFEKAVAADPNLAEAQYSLGNVLYYLQGKTPEALEHWRTALRLNPNAVPVLNQTARVLATTPQDSLRNGALAVELSEQAVRLSGGTNPAILDTLGAAYAESGRFADALQAVRRAQDLAAEQNNQRLIEALKTRAALYEAQTPLRETSPPR